MAKIVFDISDELKEKLLSKLKDFGIERNEWLAHTANLFLQASDDQDMADADSPLSMMPCVGTIGGFKISEDLPPEVIEQVIVASLREGFRKIGVELECQNPSGEIEGDVPAELRLNPRKLN